MSKALARCKDVLPQISGGNQPVWGSSLACRAKLTGKNLNFGDSNFKAGSTSSTVLIWVHVCGLFATTSSCLGCQWIFEKTRQLQCLSKSLRRVLPVWSWLYIAVRCFSTHLLRDEICRESSGQWNVGEGGRHMGSVRI